MDDTRHSLIGIAGTSYSFLGLPFDVWAAALTAVYMFVCIMDKLFPSFFAGIKICIKSLFKRKETPP